MPRPTALVLSVCLLAFLCSCVSPSAVRETGPIHLGIYADLSSSGARDGNDAVKGAQLRVEQINESGGVGGRMVDLIVLDMKQNPTEAVKAYTTLAQERKVTAVIGSSVPNAGLAVSPVADLAHVPLVSLSIDDRVTSPDLNPEIPDATGPARQFTFLVQPTAATIGAGLAAYAAEHFQLQRYATLYDPSSVVSLIEARAFEAGIKRAGKVLAVSLEMPPGDYAATLDAVKAAHAEALFVCGSVEQNAALAKEALDVAFQPLILGNQSWYAPLIDRAGAAANGVVFAMGISPDDVGLGDISVRFATKYGEKPRTAVVPGWDAVGLILAAVRKTGSSSPQKVRDALEILTGFKGLEGTFDMDRKTHRLSQLPVAIMRIWSGAYTTLEPRYVSRQSKSGSTK